MFRHVGNSFSLLLFCRSHSRKDVASRVVDNIYSQCKTPVELSSPCHSYAALVGEINVVTSGCLVAWLDDSVLQVLVANGAKIFTIDLVINQFCDKHDPMYLLLLNYFPLNFSNKSICNRILQSPLIQL
jgi:hypothetical protein